MRAVIADEWSVLRTGLGLVLSELGVNVVHQSSSASSALGALETGETDLLVLGMVSDLTQVKATQQAKRAEPDLRIIVLLPEAERELLANLLAEGSDAVIGRNASEDELRDALERVRRRHRFVGHSVLDAMFPSGSDTTVPEVDDLLTDRQRKVLTLLVEGRSRREIASAMFISEATVKTHLRNVYDKLDVSNRVEAISRAAELRLLN